MFTLKIKKGLLIVVCAIIAGVVISISQLISGYSKEVNSLKAYNRMKEDSIASYTNKLGEVVAQRDAAIVRAKDFREMENSLLRKMTQEFNGVDRKLKNLASATSANSVVKQNLTTLIKDSVIVSKINETTYDTLAVKAIDYRDEWSVIKAYALDGEVELSLEVIVPLQIVTYYPRWKLLGKQRKWLPVRRKGLKIEAKSPNPNVSITDIEHVKTNR